MRVGQTLLTAALRAQRRGERLRREGDGLGSRSRSAWRSALTRSRQTGSGRPLSRLGTTLPVLRRPDPETNEGIRMFRRPSGTLSSLPRGRAGHAPSARGRFSTKALSRAMIPPGRRIAAKITPSLRFTGSGHCSTCASAKRPAHARAAGMVHTLQSVQDAEDTPQSGRLSAVVGDRIIVFLSDRLEKPILVEGPAGVGTTELARALQRPRAACCCGCSATRAWTSRRRSTSGSTRSSCLYTQLLKDKIARPSRERRRCRRPRTASRRRRSVLQ